MLRLCTSNIESVYLGSTKINKAYLGSTLVYNSDQRHPYHAKIEYLETTGTQYIDTGIVQTTRNFEVTIQFQWIGSTVSDFESFFAYMVDGGITPRSGFHKYQGNWMFGTNVTTSTGVTVDNNVHTLFWTSNASTQQEDLYIDNVKIGTGTTTSTGISNNTISFFLGSRNRNGSIDYPAATRFMSLKYKEFSDNDHAVKTSEWDFIPVRIQQTGYMYDRVSGQLFGNSGTGDFTLGQDVHVYYEDLTYVKFTGDQYIEFDYHPNPNTKLEIEMQFEANANTQVSGGNAWLGLRNETQSGKSFGSNFGGDASQYKELFYWFEGGYVSSVWNQSYGEAIYVRDLWTYYNNNVSFLAKNTTTETKTTTNTGTLVLGGSGSLVPFKRHNLKIYSLKISNGNTLLYDCIPMSENGKSGLYNLVTNEFLTSMSGTNLQGVLKPYDGWTFGRIYNGSVNRGSNVTTGTSGGSKISPKFPCVGGHTIVYNYDSQGREPKVVQGSDYAEQSMKLYNSSGSNPTGSSSTHNLGARTGTSITNVAQLPSDAAYFEVATTYSVDNFYIYDRTSGKYIFKGKNITANSQ